MPPPLLLLLLQVTQSLVDHLNTNLKSAIDKADDAEADAAAFKQQVRPSYDCSSRRMCALS
jgi:hypothetical protein